LTTVKAYVPGIYSRSESLVQATRDLDRGRSSEQAVAEQRDADTDAFIGLQRQAGMDLLSDGLLNWQDIMRPFCEQARGLDTGPLTRFSNTNTFFRAPAVETGSPPVLTETLGETYFKSGGFPAGGWVATLPSPYTLANLAIGQERLSPVEVAEGLIGPQIARLGEKGCALAVLQETSLDSRSNGAGVSGDLLESVTALESPIPLMLQMPFADSARLVPELVELPVEGVGVDFYAADVRQLPERLPKTLVAGVLDARNSLLEKPEDIAEFGRQLRPRLEDGAELHLVPNGDLQFVPETIASQKVRILGEAAKLLREG